MTEVTYEVEDAVAFVTLNRPERLNAVNRGLVVELGSALARALDDRVGAVVLAGAGRAFCAGHDLYEEPEESANAEALARLERLQDVTRAIRRLPAPVVAAVHGYALGAGFEFALACDLVVAQTGAVFGFPEVEVGLAVTGGITGVLSRIVGPAKAKELVLLGERIDAAEAERLRLVNVVVDDALGKATAWARTMAARPRLALSLAKAALDQPSSADLEDAYSLEVNASLALMNTDEARDAANAFRQRREGDNA